MVILRDLIFQPAFPDGTVTFNTLEGARPPCVSQKVWATNYEQIRGDALTVYENPDLETIERLLGEETDMDRHILSTDVNPTNRTLEWVQSEGDSCRTFYVHISQPIQLAFCKNNGMPYVYQRSESGPLGPTNVSQTVDYTWGCGTRCLMLGELKKYQIINVSRWRTSGARLDHDTNRRLLGKEMRGYCHKYKCFAAAVFDGAHLLVLVFQARTVEEIRDERCPVIGLLFPYNSPNLRYGLYRVAMNQIRRMQAALAPPLVVLDGYTRRFRWWGGEPYWVLQNVEYDVHPNGYQRMFDRCGAWFWAYEDGTPVLYENGEPVWDTLSWDELSY